ncbi:hypothetical protein D3C78_1258690 [compost metagenome]
MSLRRNQLTHGCPVTVGIIENENVIHEFDAVFRQFTREIAVVHHQIRAAIPTPLRGILPRCRSDHLNVAVVLRKRDRQRSYAARTADDQQRFVRTGVLNVQTFKQTFPGGQGR